ncbi:hypothetical protein JCM16358_21440 [Halanaerocella petrolearia]
MEELDKIDVIVERTGASYEEAIQALKESNGDVLEAVLTIDNESQPKNKRANRETKNQTQNQNQNRSQNQKRQEETKANFQQDEFQAQGSQLVSKIRELIRQGNVTRIVVKKGDRSVLNIPVTAGLVGVVLAPYLAAIATIAAMATKYKIKVERSK